MNSAKYKKLNRSFYKSSTLELAQNLLGKFIIYNSPMGTYSARIVEVEAYIGQDDPACHAARGKTKRNAVMFGKPGFSYIYFIYGMYHCLNFVSEPEGIPAAILLRAAEPDINSDLVGLHDVKSKKWQNILSGPGKFCKGYSLTRKQNGLDLTGDILYLQDRNSSVEVIEKSPRIGIKVGTNLLWRFYDKNSKAVSGKKNGIPN